MFQNVFSTYLLWTLDFKFWEYKWWLYGMKWNQFCRINSISENSVWLKPLWFNSTKLTGPVHWVLSRKFPSVKVIYWTSGSGKIIKIQLVPWLLLAQTHSPFYKMIIPAVWLSRISTSFCHAEQLCQWTRSTYCDWHRKLMITWDCGSPLCCDLQDYIPLSLHEISLPLIHLLSQDTF